MATQTQTQTAAANRRAQIPLFIATMAARILGEDIYSEVTDLAARQDYEGIEALRARMLQRLAAQNRRGRGRGRNRNSAGSDFEAAQTAAAEGIISRVEAFMANPTHGTYIPTSLASFISGEAIAEALPF